MARVHITGASGVGTTTLGRFAAAKLGCGHFDTDDFCWLRTDPPFRQRRDEVQRVLLMQSAFGHLESFVLSGSFADWGNALAPLFDVVVFLTAPAAERVERMRHRDRERYGAAALAPGGAMHAQQEAFYAWAAQYENGAGGGRSRHGHEAWLATLHCPVIRLESLSPPASLYNILYSKLCELPRA